MNHSGQYCLIVAVFACLAANVVSSQETRRLWRAPDPIPKIVVVIGGSKYPSDSKRLYDLVLSLPFADDGTELLIPTSSEIAATWVIEGLSEIDRQRFVNEFPAAFCQPLTNQPVAFSGELFRSITIAWKLFEGGSALHWATINEVVLTHPIVIEGSESAAVILFRAWEKAANSGIHSLPECAELAKSVNWPE